MSRYRLFAALPPLGLLWLAGALTVHPRRRLVPGAALGVAATAAAVLGLVLAQGSWERFAAAFAAHARTHAFNLIEHNPGGLLDLGLRVLAAVHQQAERVCTGGARDMCVCMWVGGGC